jgi:hypothetical protein
MILVAALAASLPNAATDPQRRAMKMAARGCNLPEILPSRKRMAQT